MNSFILKRPPYSFNSWKKATASQKLRYKTLLENAFAQFNAENKHETDLYGIVYHFYTKNENIDADNLSKPVWDCLTGFLFEVAAGLVGATNDSGTSGPWPLSITFRTLIALKTSSAPPM